MSSENGHAPGRVAWLNRYLQHTAIQEAPTLFHRWVGIATMAHVLGRRVWVSKAGYYPIYPAQVMVCLVSPSAVLRKSTALNEGVKLLETLQLRQPGVVNVLSDRLSPQSFIEQLQPRDELGMPIEEADCVGLFKASELGAALSNDSWNETLPTLITALNDAPAGMFNGETCGYDVSYWREKYVTKGAVMLRNPCIGMLAATTPTGLSKELPKHAKTAGFFGRVFWVYAEDSDRPPNAMLSPRPKSEGSEQALIEGLLRASKYEGLVRWTKEARVWAEEWYQEHHKAPRPRESLASGFWSRKQDHSIRIAIVLAAMDDSVSQKHGGLVIQLPHIQTATKDVERIERGLGRCFTQLEAHGQATLQQRILKMAERYRAKEKEGEARWLTRYEIIKRMWDGGYHSKDVDEALKQLSEVRHLRMRGRGTAAEYRYRPPAGALMRRASEATMALGEEPPQGAEE